MKTLLLSILTLALCNLNIMAQDAKPDNRGDVMVGIKAGMNNANVYNTKGDNFQANSRIGFAGGAFVVIPIIPLIGIQPEILYSQKGYNGNGIILGNTYNVTHTTSFIDIPIFLTVKPSKWFTVMAGPQYSYLINQKDVFTAGTISTTQESNFQNSNVRKNILCFIGGFDFNYQHLVFGARVGWDIQNNNGDGTSSNPQYKNEWLQVTLGIRI